MNHPRWIQDSRGREHAEQWRRYGMLQHNHQWADTLRPTDCGTCRTITAKGVRLWN